MILSSNIENCSTILTLCEYKPTHIYRVINRSDPKIIHILGWCDDHKSWVNDSWKIEDEISLEEAKIYEVLEG